MLESIVGLQPLVAASDAASRNAMLLGKVRGLAEGIPVSCDLKELKYKLQKDDNPLSVVLLQEMERYNALLDMLASHLA